MHIGTLFSHLIVFGLANTALGACLLDDYSVGAEYGRSIAVVTATVLSERTVPDKKEPEFIAGTFYTLRILESFRGTLTNTAEVYSENSSGSFPMEKGKSYLLFLYRAEGGLSADPCGNSGLVSEKKDVLETVRALRKTSVRDQKPNKSLQAFERFGWIAKRVWLWSVEPKAGGRMHGKCMSPLNHL